MYMCMHVLSWSYSSLLAGSSHLASLQVCWTQTVSTIVRLRSILLEEEWNSKCPQLGLSFAGLLQVAFPWVALVGVLHHQLLLYFQTAD